MAAARNSKSKAHVLAVPMPYQGHLNSLMRLCKALAKHDILMTFVEPYITDSASHADDQNHGNIIVQQEDTDSGNYLRRARFPIQLTLQESSHDLKSDHRPPPQSAFLGSLHMQVRAALVQFVDRLLSIQEEPRITCIISDILLSSIALDIASTLTIPSIAFGPCGPSADLFFQHLSNGLLPLEDALKAVAKDDADLFQYHLPGLPPLRNRDLPHFDVPEDAEFLYPFEAREIGLACKKAELIVVNASHALEGPALELPRGVPVCAVGPLIEELSGHHNTSRFNEQDDCVDWLDKQPPSSVLYISMGSVAIWSEQQFQEILHGLEASHQRFLWVLRSDVVEGRKTECPDWFIASTKERGYIVSWAPQMRVLEHGSVGGFLTHCGWNSTTEAVMKGVAMLCWPYLGDQSMNCRLVVEEWKVGVRLRGDGGLLVSRDEVEKKIRLLMEGEEGKMLKNNASKLCQACLQSLQPNGSSYVHMQTLVGRLITQHDRPPK